MSTLRFVGSAVITAITAVAPIVVVAGMGLAHAAAPNIGDPCTVDGATTRADDGTLLQCMHPAHGAPLVWIGISNPSS